ncbi:hypothetical protein [Microbacterium hominis]|uniref:Uncharacterized protein n=1 Tax=Microbacterium hominis TaxID=162426 RepID=A0A7D4TRQ5_9MICO|nr:hypothetical protein [Microbacterium hominis]QKJ20184.1 hypothetical protein HQM25_12980 [Microbacterium hominis]
MTIERRRGIAAASIALGLLVVGALFALVVRPWLQLGGPVGGPQQELAWLARGVLALALAWLVIGILAARTSLVRRPGAAGARASWLGSTRPWRARESALGVLAFDRWLMITVPVALIIGTRTLQSSFTAWAELAAVLAGWLVFALVVRLLVGRHSPWPVIAAMGGAIAIHSVLSLSVIAIAGPEAWWNAVGVRPALLVAATAISFAATAWVLVAGGWALITQFGLRRAIGIVLAGLGAGVAVGAAIIAGVGFGPSTPMTVPPLTPWIAGGVAVLIAALGVALWGSWRRD